MSSAPDHQDSNGSSREPSTSTCDRLDWRPGPTPLPGFQMLQPIIPEWNDLTNDQRRAICDRAEYWDCEECEPISRDAAHGMYLIIREVLDVGLAPSSLTPNLRDGSRDDPMTDLPPSPPDGESGS